MKKKFFKYFLSISICSTVSLHGKDIKELKKAEGKVIEEPEDEIHRSLFLVNFSPEFKLQRWIAKAFELRAYKHISDYGRLSWNPSHVSKIDSCKNLECRLKFSQKNNILFIVDGKIKNNTLFFQIYDSRTEIRFASAWFSINSSTKITGFKVSLLKSLKSITEVGGVLDKIDAKILEKRNRNKQNLQRKQEQEILIKKEQEEQIQSENSTKKKKGENQPKTVIPKIVDFMKKPVSETNSNSDQTPSFQEKKEAIKDKDKKKDQTVSKQDLSLLEIFIKGSRDFIFLNRPTIKTYFVFIIGLLILFPFILFTVLNFRKKTIGKQFNISTLFMLAIASGFFIAINYDSQEWTMLKIGNKDLQNHMINIAYLVRKFFIEQPWIPPSISGLLWGNVILILLKTLFPVIQGFERIENHVLAPLVKSWFYVTCTRFLLLAIVVCPLGFFIWFGNELFEIKTDLHLTFILPASACLLWLIGVYLWDSMALFLDCRFVAGPATKHNPYHKEIIKFLNVYQKRNQIEISSRLLKKVLFLPHCNPAIDTYGGGFSKSRVVIDKELLELALGIPDDSTEKNEETSHTPIDFDEESNKANQQSQSKEAKETLVKGKDKKLKTKFINLREFKKLTSFKEFEVDADGKPGIAAADLPQENNDGKKSNEKEFIGSSIREIDNEVDANFKMNIKTDVDKYLDFLFGLILSEIGNLNSGSPFWKTLQSTLKNFSLLQKDISAQFSRSLGGQFQKNISHFGRFMADSMAPLHGGRHHMLQYLFLLGTEEDRFLTINAKNEKLSEMSLKIIENIDQLEKKLERDQGTNTSVSDRIDWLLHHQERRQRKRKNLASPKQKFINSALWILVSVVIFSFVSHSVHYQQTYQERIKNQREDIRKKEEEDKKLKNRDPKPLVP